MERKNPEITINKFAQYLSSSEVTKTSILRTIKFATEGYKRNRYNSVKSAVINYLLDNNHDLKIFDSIKQKILDRKAETPWHKDDKQNSLLALKNLEKCVIEILQPYILHGAQRVKMPELKKTNVYGVQIDLNPDILLYKRGSDKVIGAIKIIFSKNRRITPMEGQIIAGIIKSIIERKLKITLSHKNVFALDVFGQRSIQAPADYSYHNLRIKNACKEISTNWSKIKSGK